MPSPLFVHLRLHSEYSIADGIVRLDSEVWKTERDGSLSRDNEGNPIKIHVCPPVEGAKADGMPALALTDFNNVFGLVKFYKAARSAGIKPIIGCDVTVSNDNARDQPFRLLLLCQSNKGYLRLCELLTRAYLENQNGGKPEVRKEWLKANAEGLIALSGAHLGEVGVALLNGNAANARLAAHEWAGIFPGRFYLEVQRYGYAREEVHLRETVKLAAELALPVVATHPVQFLGIDDFKAHEARVCIAEGYVLNDKRRVRAFTAQQYFKTQTEMAALFADLPEALQNSVEIAKRCNLTLKLGKPCLPDFPTPHGESLDDFLRIESERGLHERLLQLFPDESVRSAKLAEYSERLDFEINTIIKMGFPGYFLIVADFIRWAKQYRAAKFPNGVPVGPGRGSGAGSLVAYSLGITDLDPLRYELLFERFLNPERVSMPDFDVDFCQDGRELVIDYVRKKYGAANVAQIATFGTMASRAVIRDVGRVMDFPYGLCDRLSKLVPFEGVKPVSLKKAREMEPEFNAIIASEEGVDELLELGERLEDLTRNVGMHAGGVLIAPGKLTDFCPLYCAEGGSADEEKKSVSQLDKDDVEAVGLVKFDFLGLRTLTIIDWAVRYIKGLRIQDSGLRIEDSGIRIEDSGLSKSADAASAAASPSSLNPQSSILISDSSFQIENIPLDDKLVYERIFKNGNTTAVFQFESSGMKDTLIKAKPDRLEDLIALNALYRPGPMDYIPNFINRKHGRENVVYPHPSMEKILSTTYGIMVYQEQVMQTAQLVAGYSLGGADLLRRAMGKKKASEMAEQRKIFVDGSAKNNIAEAQANEIFDTMEKFAGYGFNKSHAAAYSLVAYQTAYLKCHYPAAFMAATMSSDMDNTDKVHSFYKDTLEQGVTILPPDVNSSEYRFTPVDEKTVAYGLGAVKGTGESAIDNIVAARKNGCFKNLFDFCHRVDNRIVNRRTLEALIRAGAFDAISDHRAQLLATLDAALGSADQQARAANQNSLFGEDVSINMPVQMANVPRWGLREQLQHEKTSLGFYLSGHPYQEFAAELALFVKMRLADVTQANMPQNGAHRRAGKEVLLAGMVADVRIQQTRRGRMAIIKLEDGGAQLEVSVFNDLYEPSRTWIREGELLVIKGKANFDEYSGGMRVTAEEVFDFASARAAFAKRLEIVCGTPKSYSAAKLADTLKPWCGGKCPVVIHYSNLIASTPLRLGEAWQVTLPDMLLNDLRALLGTENVRVVYAE